MTTCTGRRIIFVLGMHRSGTSLVTKLLNLYGAALPKTLMAAGPNNPLGYFESTKIFEAHQRLFEGARTDWDQTRRLPAAWHGSPTGKYWVETMAEIVCEEFGDAPALVVKDPRISRLVPFWEEVAARLSLQPCYVIMLRNPLEVAASLAVSQGTLLEKAALLWLQHQLWAERDTRDRPRSIVEYDALLADWREAMERVIQQIAPDLALSPTAAAEADAFVRGDLKRQRHPFPPRRRDDWVATVFETMRDAASGEPLRTGVMDRVRRAFEASERIFAPVIESLEVSGRRALGQAQEAEGRAKRSEEKLLVATEAASKVELRADRDLERASAVASDLRQRLDRRDAELALALHIAEFSREAAISALGGPAALESFRDEMHRLAREGGHEERLAAQIARADSFFAETRRLRREKTEVGDALQERQRVVSDQRVQIEALESELGGASDRLETLSGRLAEANTQLAEIRTREARADAQLAQERVRISLLSEELQAERRRVAERDLHRERMVEEVDRIRGSFASRVLALFGSTVLVKPNPDLFLSQLFFDDIAADLIDHKVIDRSDAGDDRFAESPIRIDNCLVVIIGKRV